MASMKTFRGSASVGTQVSASSASVRRGDGCSAKYRWQQATLNIPQGTKTVDLTYTVQTDEYPY